MIGISRKEVKISDLLKGIFISLIFFITFLLIVIILFPVKKLQYLDLYNFYYWLTNGLITFIIVGTVISIRLIKNKKKSIFFIGFTSMLYVLLIKLGFLFIFDLIIQFFIKISLFFTEYQIISFFPLGLLFTQESAGLAYAVYGWVINIALILSFGGIIALLIKKFK